MSLSKEQIEHYREHGWIAPIDIMSEDEATAIKVKLEGAEAKYPDQLKAQNRNNPHISFPFIADLAFNKKIVSAAASLIGEDISLWSSVLFAKDPNSSSYVSWHQDATYMAMKSDNHVTGWFALTHSEVESGCVAVIPETHHDGIVVHKDTFGNDNILTRGQKIENIDASKAINLILKPGQMSFHHPWLVHGSLPNRSNYRRIGIALQTYMSPEVRPTRGEHHVMHIQGTKPIQDFISVPRPNEECSDGNIRAREAANKAFSDVLYQGAKIRRRL